MYIVTNDNKHIIIDFKTDKLDSKQQFIDRYRIQLHVYKKAIETAYNIEIDKVYIYSFNLKEIIEV